MIEYILALLIQSFATCDVTVLATQEGRLVDRVRITYMSERIRKIKLRSDEPLVFTIIGDGCEFSQFNVEDSMGRKAPQKLTLEINNQQVMTKVR